MDTQTTKQQALAAAVGEQLLRAGKLEAAQLAQVKSLQQEKGGLLGPLLGPLIGDLRGHERGRAALPAAQGPFALMLHAAGGEPHPFAD